MRTTLTLDDDVADKLRSLAHRRRIPFKQALNAALRRGLQGPVAGTKRRKPFRVMTFSSGFQPGVDPLRLNQLNDELEVERFLSRKK